MSGRAAPGRLARPDGGQTARGTAPPGRPPSERFTRRTCDETRWTDRSGGRPEIGSAPRQAGDRIGDPVAYYHHGGRQLKAPIAGLGLRLRRDRQ